MIDVIKCQVFTNGMIKGLKLHKCLPMLVCVFVGLSFSIAIRLIRSKQNTNFHDVWHGRQVALSTPNAERLSVAGISTNGTGTNRHTHTPKKTNLNQNITPPPFRVDVKNQNSIRVSVY